MMATCRFMSERDHGVILLHNSLLFFHVIQEIEYINITWQSKSHFHLSSEQNQIFVFLFSLLMF